MVCELHFEVKTAILMIALILLCSVHVLCETIRAICQMVPWYMSRALAFSTYRRNGRPILAGLLGFIKIYHKSFMNLSDNSHVDNIKHCRPTQNYSLLSLLIRYKKNYA